MCSTQQQEKTGTWGQIFPSETVSEQQSALFVKKLLAVAVSNITYLRAIFPENAFGDRCLEDLNLKILRDDSTCPGACQVIKWVKGCFDALDKKYLRMLVIGIYVDPENPETVIESYTFKFSYSENGGIDIYRNDKKLSSAYSSAETKKATIRLLRMIVVLATSLQSLPDDVMLTMKLLYYDDVTPNDYEPPGFQASEAESFAFREDPMNIKVGDIATPFHTVKLRIKTDGQQFELGEEPLEAGTQSTHPETQSQAQTQEEAAVGVGLDAEESQAMDVEGEIVLDGEADAVSLKNRKNKSEGLQVVPQPLEADSVPSQQTPLQSGMLAGAVGTTPGSVTSNVEGSVIEDPGVHCACGCNEDDGLMILCAKCNFWQHGVCYKVLEEEEAPQRHICESCADANDPDLQPTDAQLQGLAEVALQATCLWRRALVACMELNRLLPVNLSKRLGVEITVAQGLMNRLENEGYLRAAAKGKRLGKLVNKDKLKSDGLKKYFKKNKPQEPKQEEDIKNTEPEAPLVMDVEEEQPKSKSPVDTEIEKITAKAEGMNLTGKKQKKPRDKHRPKPQKGNSSNETSTQQARGQKRVKAMDGQEFELTSSQDMSQDFQTEGRSKAKRRKASVAKKAIRV